MSRLTLALGVILLVVEAAAVAAIVATTSAASDRSTTIVFTTVLGTVFVASGLIALARRPENRTGVYLAAVGYLGFLNGLTASQDEWVFAFGWVVEGLIWAPFTALVLSFPTGSSAAGWRT